MAHPVAHRRVAAGGIVLALALVLAVLSGPAAAHTPAAHRLNPIVFVHGGAGSGAQFESQQLRFTSNGYPQRLIRVLEYDSTFSLNTMEDVHNKLDQLIATLQQETGRPQADVLGHSLGTTVMHGYLNSSPARAAKVAHYVNIDGRTADSPPGGVPTLAIWAGRGAPGRAIGGAVNVTVPNQTHVQSATSAESFVEYYKFFTGEAPKHDIVPQTGAITIAGRLLHVPVNRGAVGATLEIWEVDGATGRRKASAPVATLSIGDDGNWGPVEVVAGRHYEFSVLRPGTPTHHHYYEPFVRSDHLVRLLESDALANLGERGPRHVAGVILRYKEVWGNQGSQNDVLSINGANVATEVLCPISKQVNAIFFSDRKADGQSDLSRQDPVYSSLPFVIGVDLFAPAAIPPDGKTTLELRSRGGGPARTVNFPNFASVTDVVTVQLNDFEQRDAATAGCLRPSKIGFKLHRMRGTRIVGVDAFVNGKRVVRRTGNDFKRLVLSGLPRDGKMSVRIETTHNTGSKVVSKRTWSGCTKGKPSVRVVRRR